MDSLKERATRIDKRPLEDQSSTEAKRINSRPPMVLESIPEDIVAYLFQFINQTDLWEVAQVCRSFRNFLKHPALTNSRTLTINCNVYEAALDHGFLRLTKRLLSMEKKGKFGWFHCIKLNRPDRMTKTWPTGGITRMVGEVRISEVTSLDMSIPRDVGFDQSQLDESEFLDYENYVQDCVPEMLCLMLPNLRRINLSNVSMTTDGVEHFFKRCKNLETLVWNYCKNIVSLWGWELHCFDGLKELQMDDAIFSTGEYFLDVLNDNSTRHCHCFLSQSGYAKSMVRNSLERVSLLNMRYQIEDSEEIVPITQEHLMHFVRLRENLKWFRSDLTPENTAILKAEYPHIIFVSE